MTRRPPFAFTLIELVASLAMISMVLLACASLTALATRSINSGSSGAAANAAAARYATDLIADDLKMAMAITEQTATSVAFTVPGRNGDLQPETIRYAWSGTPGGALTRQYNGGTPVSIAANVQAFRLSYLLQTVGTTAGTESAEQLLVAHDGGSGSNVRSYPLKNNAWVSEYVNPGLPGSTLAWRITHIKLQLQRVGTSTGTIFVNVTKATGGQNPATILETQTINVASLPTSSIGWADISFSSLKGLDPTQGICVEIGTMAGSNVANYNYDTTSSDVGTSISYSSNQGKAWSGQSTKQSLQYYIYGTLTN